ncbi:MAG: efflux RND transporter periplasmic adaptor subunit [Desulfobacterales bacterium]
MDKRLAEKLRRIVPQVAKALGLLALLVVLMLWLSGAFLRKVAPGPPRPRGKPPALTTHKVARRSYPLIIDQVGSLQAHTQAQISSRIMSQVKEILVQEGDMVVGSDTAGQSSTVMARLDDRDIRMQLREARAQVTALLWAREAAVAKLGAAEAQLKSALADVKEVLSDFLRYQELHRNQAATGQQLEHARANKQMAEARVQAARQEAKAVENEIERIDARKKQAEAAAAGAQVMLSYTVIQAPFSGRVVKKMMDIGDMAGPGQPLFFLEVPSRPELHAFVSESLIPRLKIGQELGVGVEALGRHYTGTLREIIPQADPVTRTVLVKVSLPADVDLVNGLFGRLAVPCGTYETLVVPESAVREVGQLHLVEVLDAEGYPQRRFVTLGRRHDGLLEVLSGVKVDEEVVVP